VSEYQYYEFRAVDRPLDERALRTLRALSTRADITPTSFVNTYNWGDFKGDPDALMEKCFDAFVYVANWGTRRFVLRLPGRSLTRVWSHRRIQGALSNLGHELARSTIAKILSRRGIEPALSGFGRRLAC